MNVWGFIITTELDLGIMARCSPKDSSGYEEVGWLCLRLQTVHLGRKSSKDLPVYLYKPRLGFRGNRLRRDLCAGGCRGSFVINTCGEEKSTAWLSRGRSWA